MVRVLVAAAVLACLAGCGGHARPAALPPRSVTEVQRAFARHGIHLLRVQAAAGPQLKRPVLFGQSGSLSVSVQVYRRVRPGRSAPGVRSVRNVLATWQGADSRSVEAAMDALR
jgi:hypothetical protein